MAAMMKAGIAAGVAALVVSGLTGGTAHAVPDTGCRIDNNYVHNAVTMVPGLANTPIVGPNSIQSEGYLIAQWTAQGYSFDAINRQVARDLHVDTATAAALMGYTGCEIP